MRGAQGYVFWAVACGALLGRAVDQVHLVHELWREGSGAVGGKLLHDLADLGALEPEAAQQHLSEFHLIDRRDETILSTKV